MARLEPFYDADTVAYAKHEEGRIKDLDDRLEEEELDTSRPRNPYFRDYGRIMYSSSFRRLQGKMQLLGIEQTNFYRNRLTHSLEVSQISRGIAERLDLTTTVVAEASSLAHDLGNPPFGHHGERVLNRLASDIGGYEGNAQTLRILMRLEKKHPDYRGLNLTLRTLLGVIKYPQLRGDGTVRGGIKEKFIYRADYNDIEEKLCGSGLGVDARTIDMQVMNLADEIAYAAHDLEDCLSIGYFTVEELLHVFQRSDDYREAHDLLLGIVQNCRKFANQAHSVGTAEAYSFLFRKELTSQIVNTLVKNIYFRDEGDKPGLAYRDHFQKLAEGLKNLAFREVLRKPAVRLYEQRGEKVVEGLFRVYCDENFNKDLVLLPPEFRTGNIDEERQRSVIDYIGGMMDSFAIQEFKRYFGESEYNRLYKD